MGVFSTDPKTTLFLQSAFEELKESQVEVRFYKRDIKIKEDIFVDGYFDDSNKIIAVKKNRQWIQTFVHEYSHFLQWKYKDPSYLAYTNRDYDPIEITEKWIEDKIDYSTLVSKSFRIVRRNEYECEKKSIQLIKEFDLPVDIEMYSRRANVYLIFYHMVEKTKMWNLKKNLYSARILEQVPNTLRSSYVDRVPERLINIVTGCFL